MLCLGGCRSGCSENYRLPLEVHYGSHTDKQQTHPGEMLGEEFPIPIKITQRQLADALHVPYQRINELVNQERGVTPSKALRLGRCFGSSPDFWLNLQVKWDLYKARQSESDALADIKDYQHFRKKGTGVELLFRLFTILTKLIEPGSSRAVIAENLLMKQQLIIHSRTRQRAGA